MLVERLNRGVEDRERREGWEVRRIQPRSLEVVAEQRVHVDVEQEMLPSWQRLRWCPLSYTALRKHSQTENRRQHLPSAAAHRFPRKLHDHQKLVPASVRHGPPTPEAGLVRVSTRKTFTPPISSLPRSPSLSRGLTLTVRAFPARHLCNRAHG